MNESSWGAPPGDRQPRPEPSAAPGLNVPYGSPDPGVPGHRTGPADQQEIQLLPPVADGNGGPLTRPASPEGSPPRGGPQVRGRPAGWSGPGAGPAPAGPRPPGRPLSGGDPAQTRPMPPVPGAAPDAGRNDDERKAAARLSGPLFRDEVAPPSSAEETAILPLVPSGPPAGGPGDRRQGNGPAGGHRGHGRNGPGGGDGPGPGPRQDGWSSARPRQQSRNTTGPRQQGGWNGAGGGAGDGDTHDNGEAPATGPGDGGGRAGPRHGAPQPPGPAHGDRAARGPAGQGPVPPGPARQGPAPQDPAYRGHGPGHHGPRPPVPPSSHGGQQHRPPGPPPPGGVPAPPPGASPAPRAGRAGRNLKAAIGVGVGLGVVIVASLFVFKVAFVGVVVVAVVVGLWELTTRLSERKDLQVPLIPLAVGGTAMLVAGYARGAEGAWAAMALTALTLLVWRMTGPPGNYLRDVTAGVFAAFYVPFLATFVVLMLAADDGAWRVLTFLLLTVCSDTGAYAVGARFGRRKLAPRISPGKTREGLLGAIGFSMAAGALCMEFAVDGGTWWQGLVTGLLVAVSATLGDLGESMIKRDLGIKDMGTLLPGHGGIMDRLDSLLPTAPVVWLLFVIFLGSG